MNMLLAATALFAFAQSDADPIPGIDIRYGWDGHQSRVTIWEGGRLRIELYSQPETRDFTVDNSHYRRIDSMLKSLRRFAGKTVTCDDPRVEAARRAGVEPISAVVKWAPAGIAVRVPLSCEKGPTQAEISATRDAIDTLLRLK